MAVAQVYNAKNEQVGEVTLKDDLFGVEVKPHILHDVVRMQLANRRSGNSSTKTRVEVAGSGAKPWKQKGTGRARSGSRRSPIWRGGGIAFGPKPRDYSYKLPKKVRKLGLIMALSARVSEDQLKVVDSLEMAEIKTKDFVGFMNNLEAKNVLVIIPDHDENIEKSSRNIPKVKVLPVSGLNVYDVLLHEKLILVQTSIAKLEERLLS
ncbi:MAG: 50S ribosomal protein L4 [Desulfurivibrionaceae bacterium]|nr:50S ribosomal protein L4 [Desulfurivibrionaceae bacterium]